MTTNRPTARATLGAIALGIALGGTAIAQTQADQDHTAHHPGGATAQATPTTPAPGSPAVPPRGGPGMGGPGMPGPGGQQGTMPGMMGGDMQRMMQMMHERMAAQGAMRPFRHIEGQLAYARAELHIAEAQAPQWNAFADAVRAAAERLRQAQAQALQGAGQPATAPALLERRSTLLTARLEAIRAVAATAGPLYAALSDEQKRTADELMAEHLRDMGRGAM
jgi:LTXXQ motif family protein